MGRIDAGELENRESLSGKKLVLPVRAVVDF